MCCWRWWAWHRRARSSALMVLMNDDDVSTSSIHVYACLPAAQCYFQAQTTRRAFGDSLSYRRGHVISHQCLHVPRLVETLPVQLITHFITDLPQPKLAGLTAEPVLPPVTELSAKPPQTPPKDTPIQHTPTPPVQVQQQPKQFRPAMDDPEDDPWGSPDMHKAHHHGPPRSNGAQSHNTNGHTGFGETPPTAEIAAPAIAHIAEPPAAPPNGGRQNSSNSVTTPSGWGYFDGHNTGVGGFGESPAGPVQNPFGTAPDPTPSTQGPPGLPHHTSSGRTGHSLEENVVVVLMPEKEGMFMFQHHNYEVSSLRRGSKVIRRYSDFVWLLDCLHKRYPFRVLPLLPPKRVGVNGSHLSNDGAFIEKRRRGLARFLNALVRHPILSQEQLVVMFLTVPTVS